MYISDDFNKTVHDVTKQRYQVFLIYILFGKSEK